MDKQVEALAMAFVFLGAGFLLSQGLPLFAVILIILSFAIGTVLGLIKA